MVIVLQIQSLIYIFLNHSFFKLAIIREVIRVSLLPLLYPRLRVLVLLLLIQGNDFLRAALFPLHLRSYLSPKLRFSLEVFGGAGAGRRHHKVCIGMALNVSDSFCDLGRGLRLELDLGFIRGLKHVVYLVLHLVEYGGSLLRCDVLGGGRLFYFKDIALGVLRKRFVENGLGLFVQVL